MRPSLFAAIAAFVALVLAGPARAAPREDPLAVKVNDAINLGVRFLRDRGAKGNWEADVASATNPGGWSALALLALLNAGVPPDDPVVKRGLEYLRTVKPQHTYVVSLQTMVLARARQDGDRDQIRQNVKWLLDSRTPKGWSYTPNDQRGPDNSNTQYALLALHEALQAGVEVDPRALKDVQDFYRRTQLENGSWEYKTGTGPRLTMTTAGLCGLYITGMDLNAGLQQLRPDGSAVNCGKYDENPNVARALKWLGDRFPAQLTKTTIREQRIIPEYYALYGIERAGRLSGQRYLGNQDWYRVGCEYLVKEQKGNGSWRGDSLGDTFEVVATSFALLFLSKGRTPVLMTKLAYGPADRDLWNNKRNDTRNLVEFTSRELFKRQPMAWQVFDVRNKLADTKAARQDLAAELLQSPVVYFNGHTQAPRGKEEEILKEYLDNGGFVFAEACCGSELFERDFVALMKRIFPDNELKPLDPKHPIWTASGKFAVPPGKPFPLYGIEQGCKTVVVFSPKPISGYWEANESKRGNGEAAFQLGANIIAYATGLEPPKYKGTEVEVFRGDPHKADIKRGYLKVAQLKRSNGDHPARNAMRNLMVEARKSGLDVMLESEEVSPTVQDVLDYRFLYMHGRKDFQFNGADLKHLRFRLESGGLLLADACCGSKAFDASFRKFIDELFEKKLKLEPIPITDDLYSKALNGEAITKVKCRREGGKKEFLDVAPELEGVKYEGRWVVIYSKYDIGCALDMPNKATSPDCLGHDYASAVKLAKAAVLYSLIGPTTSERQK